MVAGVEGKAGVGRWVKERLVCAADRVLPAWQASALQAADPSSGCTAGHPSFSPPPLHARARCKGPSLTSGCC